MAVAKQVACSPVPKLPTVATCLLFQQAWKSNSSSFYVYVPVGAGKGNVGLWEGLHSTNIEVVNVTHKVLKFPLLLHYAREKVEHCLGPGNCVQVSFESIKQDEGFQWV